jgi:hypothetical protein
LIRRLHRPTGDFEHGDSPGQHFDTSCVTLTPHETGLFGTMPHRFFLAVADLLEPFYDSPFEFPPKQFEYWSRLAVFRSARLTLAPIDPDGEPMPFGVFRVIGVEYAKRVDRAGRPLEIHLLRNLSAAFDEVETRAHQALHVPDVHIDRLVHAISRYLAYIGRPHDASEVRQNILDYVDTTTYYRRAEQRRE